MTSADNHDPWVIRTDFSDEAKWKTVCELVAAPQSSDQFYAYVRYVSDQKFTRMERNDLVHALPDDYPGFFCFVVDQTTLESEEHPILVIGFSPHSTELEDYQRTPSETPIAEIQSFRAIPSTIQSIQNNLSLANLDFEDFAISAEDDGVFRGFSR